MTTSSIRPFAGTAPAPSVGRVRRGGLVVAAVVIAGLFALPGLPALASAWSGAELGGAHRIHDLAGGWHGLIILVGAVALLRERWRVSGAAQLLVAIVPSIVVAASVGMLPAAAAVAPVVILAATVALLPDRGRLLALRPSLPLLGIALAGAALLGAFATESLRLQAVLPHAEPHAAVHHWAGMGIFAITLAALAALAALRLPGWRLTLWTAAATAAVWGLASVAWPAHPSSLGVAWGAAAAAAAAVFVAVGEVSSRPARPPADRRSRR